ncbi:MAG: hypothetical protein IIU11_11140 [Bacteroidales bacterium]|nr:hypothetical protein [Bacteroidales bacterium]
MKISLNEFDSKRLENLNVRFQNNGAAFEVVADFVNRNERFITPEMLNQIVEEYQMQPSLAYAMLLASACGLEIYDNQAHKEFFNDYFSPSVRELNVKDFSSDKYLKTIKFPKKTFKNWEFTYLNYSPCEAFVFDEPVLTSDFREYPQIGFFSENFTFPAVMQDGREWMAVKPNEIMTMQQPLENAHGKVLTLGLGLGYFAFMSSEKKSVESVTIVEKDENIIKLFSDEILPQFPEKQKITIINDDAFEYMERLLEKEKHFDYIFSDIWHDTSDGLPMYLKLKRLNSKLKGVECDYWIEKSLLSSLRFTVFNQMYKIFKNPSQTSSENEKVIKTYREFTDMISDSGLKNIKIK